MENIFKNTKKHSEFTWDNLGDIKKGCIDLGEDYSLNINCCYRSD